jgi:hypothetical protein
MSHETTVQPGAPPVDVTVEPPDVVEVPLTEPQPLAVTVEPPCGTEAHVETTVPPVLAQAVSGAAPVEARVAPPADIEAQVLNRGYVTIIRDGGDVGFVEWAEYPYTATGINLVKVLEPGNVVNDIKLLVMEAFDGNPTLEIGSAADPDLWLSLGAVELAQLCEYHNDALTKFLVAERINLTLSTPGSTQGRVGLLYRVIL